MRMRSLREKILAGRLVVHERTPSGRARNYRDPETGAVYTARERRTALNHGLNPEQVTAVRKAGQWDTIQKAVRRHEHPEYLLEKWQERALRETGKRPAASRVLKSARFWEAVESLRDPDTKATGRKAKALENFGLRPRGAPYPVGQSPKRQ